MKIIGFIEQVGPTGVQGWAYAPDAPDLRLAIRASLDEMVIGAGTASEFRDDLLLLGFGDGHHGFTVTFDIPVNPDDVGLVEIVAIGPNDQMQRLGERLAPEMAETSAAPEPAAPAPSEPVITDMNAHHDPIKQAEQAERVFESITGNLFPPPATEIPESEPHPAPSMRPAPPALEGLGDRAETDGTAAVEATAFLVRGDDGLADMPHAAALRTAPEVWDAPKLFVLGAARSGTSAMFSALTDVLGVPGFGESHVIPTFQRMIYQLRLYTDLFAAHDEDIMIKRLDRNDLERILHRYVRNLYWTTFEGSGFVDKTPTGEAIYGAPLIEVIFPDSHLIVMRRTGIEVVKSFRVKFSAEFAGACRAWAEAMTGILHARPLCQRMIEVDQFDMANSPFATGHELATRLGRPEKADELSRYFATTRVEKSSTHDWSKRLTLSDVDWSPQEKDVFMRICGPMMAAFGYPM